MSRLRRAQRLTIGFFLIYGLAVIFPGVAPFRGPRPFILGLPLPLAWTAAWIVAAFFVLLHLERAYRAAESRTDRES